jgi:hypothetical protein
VIYTAGAFGISAEGVGRVFRGAGAPDAQWRVVGGIEYEVAEGLWAQATFGRRFDTAREGSLVAQLGLSVNLSRERYSLDR